MPRIATQVFFALLVLAATANFASATGPTPTPGIYHSIDHPVTPGLVLTGRGANSWIGPAGGSNGTDAVFNAASFIGAIQGGQDVSGLGTQWIWSCGIADAPHSIVDQRVGGNGPVFYTQHFTGGHFWLSKDGPWGDTVNDWTGIIGGTTEITTVEYVMIGGVSTPVQSRVNINSEGTFDGGCVIQFVIANGTGVGDTDLMPKPVDYPDFLDLACGATRIYGSFGLIQDITMLIDCATPAQPRTWGALKTMYR